MKFSLVGLVALATVLPQTGRLRAAVVALSDAKTFAGWEGDTNSTWRLVDGAFVGGTLTGKIPQNEFLRTTPSYTNFILRLQSKLAGTGGFINGAVQVRSQPVNQDLTIEELP